MNIVKNVGQDIHRLASELWPINRSITGRGVRDTFSIIQNHLDGLCIKSINSHTKVFDWIIPKEWAVKEAYIISPDGSRICDYEKNNLHLVGYSKPFEGVLTLSQLQEFLYSDPECPDAIPMSLRIIICDGVFVYHTTKELTWKMGFTE